MAGDEQVSREDLNSLLNRLLELPDVNKFEVFKVLQEDLAATIISDPQSQLIEKRQRSLEAMGQVDKHLSLPRGAMPTGKQFDAAAKELGIPWTSAEVGKLWGRWRHALEVYQGQRAPFRRFQEGKYRQYRRKLEEYLGDAQKWVASNPEDLSRTAYDHYAQAQNLKSASGAVMASGEAISRKLTLRWSKVVEVAEGKLTHDEACEQELAEALPDKSEGALIGMISIARYMRMTRSTILSRFEEDPNFPTPVAHIKSDQAWLYEDIKLYKRGLPVPERREDERQALYMDAGELVERLDVSADNLRGLIRRKAWGRVPRPEGAISIGRYYWKRDKVEAWFKAKTEIGQ